MTREVTVSAASETAVDDVDLLDGVLGRRAVSPVLQPIVELETGAPAGYEALARGPAGHPLHLPAALFGTARRSGRLAELDALCQERALEVAGQAGLRSPTVLFVNVEPATVTAALPVLTASPQLSRLRDQGVRVVVELTERDLTADPAGLVAFADQVRSGGCGIALDDVGARPASLALMPLLAPDVVKLDLRLVQDQPDASIARTMTAVTAFAEEHAAAVVAEGVESEEHERTALSLGATHGQGWRYGRPAPPGDGLSSRAALWRPIVPRTAVSVASGAGAFGWAGRGRSALRGTKRLLLEVSRLLERQAADLGSLAVVLTTVQDDQHFGRVQRTRYATLAERAGLVAAIGAGLTAEPAPGVRGVAIDADDPLCREWNLVIVGPHFSAALVARDRGDGGPEIDRCFDYVLTYDRATVLEIARLLLGRIGPSPAR